MKIHAIQTGSVRIKAAQAQGRGHGLARRLAVFTDREWTDWLPTYAWVIEHQEGVKLIFDYILGLKGACTEDDGTGQAAR